MEKYDVTRPGGESLRAFRARLLDDLRAMEKMLEEGMFETGVRRIGAEQEMFLVDESGRPACAALEVLEATNDPHFTTELALFQLEFNLDPLVFGGDCFQTMEQQLKKFFSKAREAGQICGAEPVLTGILPSLRKSDMRLDNITPLPRYYALNESTQRLRGGGSRELRIKGLDEVTFVHDSVMLEACNASFQIHLQVAPDEFTRAYNAAQAYAGPTLAAATNSPMLFGRRLWQETRIALFQHAVETRDPTMEHRETPERVNFGKRWLKGSAVDLFREDITHFKTLLMPPNMDGSEDPLAMIERGKTPGLGALCLQNGTIWRWNRPCYGITAGKPHFRIENRLLPSGPSIPDQVANAAFWLGLMHHAVQRQEDFGDLMDFESVKENFIAASRQGLKAQFSWIDGEIVPAQQLIEDELLPRAREGLSGAGVEASDAERYLGILGERVRSGKTGSGWMLRSMADMKNQGTASERHSALSRAIVTRQTKGGPVHEWPLAELGEAGGWQHHYVHVEQFMTTEIFTVHEEDSIDLVANLMRWEGIRHVMVENDEHRLVGLVSYRALLRLLAEKRSRGEDLLPVSTIMKQDPISIAPETPTLEAIELMRTNGVACLPVVKKQRLVGVVTESDFMALARGLLFERLTE